MFRYLILLLFFSLSCKQNDSGLLSELDTLKTELKNTQSELSEYKKGQSGFIHSVYFWLVDDISEPQRKDFIEKGLGKLKECKHLSSIYVGPPADSEPREVVDDTYDYAWICHFKDKAAHDAYQIDPIHLSFVENYGDLFKEVKVYDNLVWDLK